jgi:hypothetical protein
MVGPGTTANVDITISAYSSDDETQQLAKTLLASGPDAVHKALEKAKAKGRISLTGTVGFYDLKLIRSTKTGNGRRIIAVTDRPIRFLEAYYSGRSKDYNFGILELDLKTDEKEREEGEGALIFAAKVKVLEGNKVEVENYGIEPVQLKGVRKL